MISLRHVTARAGGFRLEDVNLEVAEAGYGVVIGPAGAGKTTLLETIAGMTKVQSGTIVLGGIDVTNTPPEHRDLGIVYQHAYLFPHLTVRENIAYGASASAADAIAQRFELGRFADRRVASLSGGERQLVAIARALAREPKVLLLDEPFSALDPRTRAMARRILRTIYQERRFTVLQVTHDFAEAGLLGDVAIVIDAGRVVQSGDPADVFRKPATPYIADFLGAENVFAGAVSSRDAAQLQQDNRALSFTTGSLTFYTVGDAAPGPAHAVIRAEEVSLSTREPAGTSSVQNRFRGCVTEMIPDGPLTRVTVDIAGTPMVSAITSRSAAELELRLAMEVFVAFKATAVHLC